MERLEVGAAARERRSALTLRGREFKSVGPCSAGLRRGGPRERASGTHNQEMKLS